MYNSQDMKKTEVSRDGCTSKENRAYIFNRMLISHKQNEILPIFDIMDGPWWHYAMKNPSGKAQHPMTTLICEVYEKLKKNLIDIKNRSGVSRGRGRGWAKWVMVVKR